MTQFAKKLKLSNGLSIIYEHIPNSKVVSINVGVKVGSADEAPDEAGICHLIEHMVFKGSKSYGVGQIASLVEASGGEVNAYTSFDQTVFYINLPAHNFAVGMNLLKEMTFDARFDPEELEREKEVVVEEIRRGKDSPQRVLGEALFHTFYDAHPYRNPVIGTEAHVRGFSREKIYGFYKRHYTPQNMVLGVCGDITENQLSELLETLWRFETALPAQHVTIADEPAKTRHRTVIKSMNITATYFDLAFSAPALPHPDVPLLDILSFLLGESDTSLLEQNVKEKKQLVHSIYCSSFNPKHAGLFVIGGQVEPKLINEALHAIRTEILHMHTTLPAAADIERAKNILRAKVIYEKETCEGTAGKWMAYETTVGNFDFDAQYLEAITKITPADVLRAAQTYLDPSLVTLAILHPDGVKIKIDQKLFAKPKHEPKIAFKPKRAREDASIYQLSNGMRVILRENKRLPLVALKLAGLGGLRGETPANNGISSLTANLLTKGTTTRSQLQIAEQVEHLAGSLSGYVGRNSWGLTTNFLSEKFSDALPLFCDILLNPTFDPKEVAKEKRLQLESIRNQADNLSHVVFSGALKRLFAGHPFRMNMIGEPASVRALTADKIRAFHHARLDPTQLVIAASGDFDSIKLLETLDAELGGLKPLKAKKANISAPKKITKVTKVFEAKKKNQAHVAVCFTGVSIGDRDRYAMELINNVLSGQGGRLFLELRDKQSLAYTVSASLIQSLETGLFATYIASEPSKVRTALTGMFIEINKLRNTAVENDELERAKNYIVGNHELENQRNGAIAMQLALNELYGKDLAEFYDYEKNIRAVTSAQVQAAAKRFLTPEKCVISVLGPKGCFDV